MEPITADDPLARSADVVEENIDKLQTLFPEAFTEGKIDFDTLRQLLGDAVEEGQERYGLNWHGKRKARQLALTPSAATLRPAPEESEAWDTTQNLVIEGDNLEVLKLLQKSYAGRVKLIYIDPPYNTGNDFVYEDDFRQPLRRYKEVTGQVGENGAALSSNTESSGRFHTDWLNMMYPRLKVARDVLADDGVIAVSIDHREVSGLKQVLSEVFGGENEINTLVWVSNLKGRQISSHGAALTYEYVVIWAKNKENVGEFKIDVEWAKANLKSTYRGFNYEVHHDDKGAYVMKNQLYNTNSRFNEVTRPNLVYNILYNSKSGEVRTVDVDVTDAPDGFDIISPHKSSDGRHKYHAWRWGRSKVETEHEDLAFVPAESGWRIFTKVRGFDQTVLKDLVTNISTNEGTKEVEALLGARVFSYPKPVRLMQLLVQSIVSSGEDEPELVLDFFAGSGTAGHAVMAQNAVDGKERRFILVQLPETLDPQNKDQKAAATLCAKLKKPSNIAELTKERLRRAAAKVREGHTDYNGDLGFRVYKLDYSNIRAWSPDANDLEGTLLGHVENIREGRTEQDVLTELLLKLGLDLCVPIEEREIAGNTVYSVGAGALFAAFPEAITKEDAEPLALGIVGWRDELDPIGETTAVFRDGAFADDVAKTNVAAILNQHGIDTVRSL